LAPSNAPTRRALSQGDDTAPAVGSTAGSGLESVDALAGATGRIGTGESLLLQGLEHLDQAVSILDGDLRLVAANTRFFELLEFPLSMNHPDTKLEDFFRYNATRGEYGPGDVETQVAERVALARKFEPHLFERVRPDGTVLLIRGRPLPAGGFITTYLDVTARRQAEQALRASEERFRDFAEAGSDWMWEMGADLRFIGFYGNSADPIATNVSDMIGKRPDEVHDTSRDPEGWRRHLDDLENRRAFRDVSIDTLDPKGRPVRLRLSGRPFFDGDGNFAGFRGISSDVSRERELEQRAKTSELRLYDAIDSMEDSVILLDAEDRLILCNSRYREAITPFGASTQPGTPLDNMIQAAADSGYYVGGDADVSRLRSWRARRHDPGVGSIEFPVAGGRWIQLRNYPTADNGSLLLRHDITERKEYESALLREKSRSERYLAVAGTVILALDLEGRITLINRRGAEVLGYDVQDLIGVDWFGDILAPEEGPVARRWFQEVVSGLRGVTPQYENTVITRDGNRRLLQWSNTVVTDETGRIEGTLSSGEDITERRQDEVLQAARGEQMRRHAASLVALASHHTLSGHDQAGALQTVAEVFARTLGAPRASVWLYNSQTRTMDCQDIFLVELDRHVHGFTVPYDDYPDFFTSLEANRVIAADRAKADPRTKAFSPLYLDQYGLVSMIAAPVRIAGQLAGVIAAEDTRARRWTDEEQNFAASVGDIVSLAVEACRRVRTEHALVAARDAAESANRAKSAFLAHMSHELRTPLNAIIGFAEVLMSDWYQEMVTTSPDRRDEYVCDIHGSAQHLLRVINDILDLSKIEAGRFDLQDEPMDVAYAVKNTLEMLRQRIDAMQHEVTVDIPSALPPLAADERAVRQIMINLLGNAIKFTPSHGRIGVQVGINDKGSLFLSVSDTGIGIPRARIEAVLQPFTQGDATFTRVYEGTGLGLAIVRSLAHLHDGEIEIDSEEGQGTTVTISFPPERLVE